MRRPGGREHIILSAAEEEALAALGSDKEFLKPAFTDDMLDTHIELRGQESKQNSLRPASWEFQNYLDC